MLDTISTLSGHPTFGTWFAGAVGAATTAAAAIEGDWRIVAVNAVLSLGLAFIAHAAAARKNSRSDRSRKPPAIPRGTKPK